MIRTWNNVIADLGVWKRGGEVAPHKPLLLLFVLARAQHGGDNRFDYAEIDEPLKKLLREFGPARKSYHPEYPFWYLQTDDVWVLDSTESLRKRKGKDQVPRGELLRKKVSAHVPDFLWRQLRRSPRLVQSLAVNLLEQFWPPTLHHAILQAVGLDLETYGMKFVRDPSFRPAVLRAYEGRCAFCGFDGQLQGVSFGLDAAHIKWHSYDGPDDVRNGLALCAMHHVAFDRGAVSVDTGLRITVSQDLIGESAFVRDGLVDFSGASIRKPQSREYLPEPRFLQWHQRNVFKGPGREYG